LANAEWGKGRVRGHRERSRRCPIVRELLIILDAVLRTPDDIKIRDKGLRARRGKDRVVKPIVAFNKDKQKKDGVKSSCRKCCAENRRERMTKKPVGD
jgi:hypothetical protein